MYRKEIVYDRETRDYAMYLDSELVGFARTYHEAEVTLDQLVFELLSGANWTDATAKEAPALVDDGVQECTINCPGCAFCTVEVHARPAEVIEPTYVALPSALGALTDTVPSNASSLPSARQDGAITDATQPAASDLIIGAQVAVADGLYTGRIVAQLAPHFVVELDGEHDELPTDLCWRSEDDTILWACLASELTPTVSPDPATALVAPGTLLLHAYDTDPDAFLKRFDGFGPFAQARITFAVAAALGRSVGEVDAAWEQARMQNTARA
jgi:hypothetical protein